MTYETKGPSIGARPARSRTIDGIVFPFTLQHTGGTGLILKAAASIAALTRLAGGKSRVLAQLFPRLPEFPIVLISFSQWSGDLIPVPLESDAEHAHFRVLHLLTFLVFLSQPMLMLFLDVSGHDSARHNIKLERRFHVVDDYKAIEERGVCTKMQQSTPKVSPII